MRKDNNKISIDIERAYHARKYIVNYKTIYQPHYSQNAGYYATKVYGSQGSLTRQGRFFHFTADEVNKLLKCNLLLEY
jgi:hypothetical protein